MALWPGLEATALLKQGQHAGWSNIVNATCQPRLNIVLDDFGLSSSLLETSKCNMLHPTMLNDSGPTCLPHLDKQKVIANNGFGLICCWQALYVNMNHHTSNKKIFPTLVRHKPWPSITHKDLGVTSLKMRSPDRHQVIPTILLGTAFINIFNKNKSTVRNITDHHWYLHEITLYMPWTNNKSRSLYCNLSRVQISLVHGLLFLKLC